MTKIALPALLPGTLLLPLLFGLAFPAYLSQKSSVYVATGSVTYCGKPGEEGYGEDKPVAQATVTLSLFSDLVIQKFYDPKASVLSVKTVTDAGGRFRVELPKEGRWVVAWEKPGMYPNGAFDPNNSEPGNVAGDEVVAESGSVSPRYIQLWMRRSSFLIGRVQSPNGSSAANETIQLIHPPYSGCVPAPAPTPPVVLRTDAQGRFRREVPGESDTFGVWQSSGNYAPITAFPLEEGEEKRFIIRLVVPASISGTVTAHDGRTPVEGAQIWSCRGHWQEQGRPVTTVLLATPRTTGA